MEIQANQDQGKDQDQNQDQGKDQDQGSYMEKFPSTADGIGSSG